MARLLPQLSADVEDLPTDEQRALRALAAGGHAPERLDRPLSLAPGCALALGLALAAYLGALVVSGAGVAGAGDWRSCVPWDGSDRRNVLLLSLASASLVVHAAVALVRRRRAPFGAFWGVVGGWLVDVEVRRVRVYPLAHLEVDPDPPGRTLRLRRGDAVLDVDLAVRGGSAFEAAVRAQIAEHAHGGYRDAGPEAPAAAAASPEHRTRDGGSGARARLAVWALALGIGGLAGGWGLPAVRGTLSERVTWRACASAKETAPCAWYLERYSRDGHVDAGTTGTSPPNPVDDAFFHAACASMDGLDRYADAFPRGAHLAGIVAARRALLGEAGAALRRRPAPPGDEGADGAKLIAAALDALARAGEGRTIQLRFTHVVERGKLSAKDLARLKELAGDEQGGIETVLAKRALEEGRDPLELFYPEEKMDPPSASAFPDEAAPEHEADFAAELERGLAEALPALDLRVRQLAQGAQPGAATVVLDVGYTVTLRRQVAPGRPWVGRAPTSFWEMTSLFTVTMAPPSGGGERFTLAAYPPHDHSCVEPRDLHAAQRRAAFHLLAERWSASVGLDVQPSNTCPRAELRPPASELSPGVVYLDGMGLTLHRKTPP